MKSYKKQCESLVKLINKVSDYYGGDDILWLEGYIEEVIKNNSNDIEKAIKCFETLI